MCAGLSVLHSLQVSHGSTMFLYNMDFAMEWPRPLPPNVQLVGALLPTQAKPLPPVFQVRMQHQLRFGMPALQPARCSAGKQK